MPTALRMYQDAASLFKDMGDKKEYAGAERSLGKAFLREADFVGSSRLCLKRFLLITTLVPKPKQTWTKSSLRKSRWHKQDQWTWPRSGPR